MSWLDQVVESVSRDRLEPELIDVCRAFGGDTAGPPIDDADALGRRVVQVLADEVDRDQAELFSRRFLACAQLLAGLDDTAAILGVALRGRVSEILDAPGPRALRVRACVDYFTSHGAIRHHATPGAPTAVDRVLGAGWQHVATGLSHALVQGQTDRGPIRVNLLRVDDRRTLRCLDLRVSELGRPLAAVTGGFFLYSEPDIAPPFARGEPVGLLIQDGDVRVGPFLRRAALSCTRKGERAIQAASPVNQKVLGVRVGAVNDATLVHRVPVVFNRAFGERSPWHGGHAIALANGRRVGDAPGQLPIPLHGFVLSLPAGHPVPRGFDVEWSADQVTQAMAGGPQLLRDGRITLDLASEDFAGTAPPRTFSQDETFDQNLLPRMVVGLRDQTLFFAAIDGRHFEQAPGMTLGQSARLLQALGCKTAMNLDGGSSKRMWVRGREVDLSSTELVTGHAQNERKRPIRTAIVIE